jgi:hypothetical protein
MGRLAMNSHPNRLVLLVSLMGFGLSAGTPARAEDDPAHDDVARVMRVLGLEATTGRPFGAPAPAAVVPRPAKVAVRVPRAEEHRALLQLIRPAAEVVLEAADMAPAVDVVPQDADASVPAAPAAPVSPDMPDDAHVLVGLTGRPVEEPDDRDPLHGAPWTLDWLPPPGPPSPPVEGDPAAVLVDLAAGPADPEGMWTAQAPLDAAQGIVLTTMPSVAVADVHVERITKTLAGVRVAEALPAEDVALVNDSPAPALEEDIAPPRSTPRADYVQARLAERGDAADTTPADRVLNALAALRGMPEVEETPAEPPTIAALKPQPAPEPVVPAGPARAAVSPIERVLNDLAALRGVLEAEESEPARAPWHGEQVAMSSTRLEDVRGGFMTDTGLKLSFGIERAVYINGALVTMTSLNVSDLGKLSAGQAAVASLNGGALAVVQSGTGNSFAPGAVTASAVGTVIQNTLDNQKIQNVTVVNATVNSAEVMRGMNLQNAVRSAITSSIRR